MFTWYQSGSIQPREKKIRGKTLADQSGVEGTVHRTLFIAEVLFIKSTVHRLQFTACYCSPSTIHHKRLRMSVANLLCEIESIQLPINIV